MLILHSKLQNVSMRHLLSLKGRELMSGDIPIGIKIPIAYSVLWLPLKIRRFKRVKANHC